MLPESVTYNIIILVVSQLFVAGSIYGGFRVGIASLCRRVTRVEDRQDKIEERELGRAEGTSRLNLRRD